MLTAKAERQIHVKPKIPPHDLWISVNDTKTELQTSCIKGNVLAYPHVIARPHFWINRKWFVIKSNRMKNKRLFHSCVDISSV